MRSPLMARFLRRPTPAAPPPVSVPAVEMHHVSWQGEHDPWPHVVDCMNAADAQVVAKALQGLDLKAVAWCATREPAPVGRVA